MSPLTSGLRVRGTNQGGGEQGGSEEDTDEREREATGRLNDWPASERESEWLCEKEGNLGKRR